MAWFGTAMLIATAPYVARATLDDIGVTSTSDAVPTDEIAMDDAGGVAEDAPADTSDLAEDATAPSSDAEIAGPRLPNGEPPPPPDLAADTGGCSCRSFSPPPSSSIPSSGPSSGHAAMLSVLALALLGRRR